MTFRPTSQVLADKMIIHTRDGHNTGDIRITCYQDGAATVVTGFIDLHNEESLTVGWNCELIGEEIRVPAVAKELLDSRLGDTATKRRRGSRLFSLVAANSNGMMTTGVTSNNRVSRFNKMMSRDRPSATAVSRTSTDSTTLSTLLIVAATTGGMAAIGALAYYCSRLRDLQQSHKRGYNNQATAA